jgi:subtilisin family serine protease
VKRSVLAALAGLALAAPASAAVVPSGWTIADTGPRGGTTYAGPSVDGVGALYLPSGLQPGRRLRVAYLLGGPGAGANTARALGIAAAADELLWQRTTPPFAVVVTSAGGRRTLAAAMRFAQQACHPSVSRRAEP